MKTKFFLILISSVTALCLCFSALCENTAAAVLVQGDEWSWSRGAYNTFSGEINLSDCTADELTVSISADLPYNTETEQKSRPVFTSVNGKRIVMTKQSDMVQITPDAEKPTMAFSASFRLPEKKHVSSVPLLFRITDAGGNEIKTIYASIESGQNGTGGKGNPYYIPADINMITLCTAAAAALIWALVLVRSFQSKKKKEQEN